MGIKHICQGISCGILVLAMSLIGCGSPWAGCIHGSHEGERVRFMSYNVQNLFDGKYDGDEYPEFDPRSDAWGLSAYHQRLSRLREVIVSAAGSPDVVMLQEIEGPDVLEDLVKGYLRGEGYDYIAASLQAGSAIEVGIISKFPITDVRFHYGQIGQWRTPRPIMEAEVVLPWGTCYLFNSHWKSKIGGAQQTEPYRLASAAALKNRIKEIAGEDPDVYIIAAGDFNTTPWDYRNSSGEYVPALMIYEDVRASGYDVRYDASLWLTADESQLCKAKGSLFSPWLEDHHQDAGTFWYRGAWEAIDHIAGCISFFNGMGMEYSSFAVITEGLVLDSGEPYRYDLRTGAGYSDHLPVVLTVMTVR